MGEFCIYFLLLLKTGLFYLSVSWREKSLKGAALFVFDVCRSLCSSNIVSLSYLSIIRGGGGGGDTVILLAAHSFGLF